MIRLLILSLLLTGCSGEPYGDARAGYSLALLIWVAWMISSIVHRRERKELRSDALYWRLCAEDRSAKFREQFAKRSTSMDTFIQRQEKAKRKAERLKSEIDRLTEPFRYSGDWHQ